MTDPSSTQPQPTHLIIIEDEKGQRELTLQASVYSIGRHEQNDIRLYSQFASRRHATLIRLSKEDGSYYYRIIDGDLEGKGSRSGIIVNGNKVPSHDLTNGDEIAFNSLTRISYSLLLRETPPNPPASDEFDITLIDPSMMIEDEV
ncbi:FHA domain-containing protein [Roseofilum sp. BLCC_M91]|uniref:FHA domain-containing protein n=1 Tax=Roseofilum halophilum BLCC-M91 TaxID=3022259 RepID=A0ABT7BGP7_9CYAN|nr:FHA domain-containing protein [Roseofilum halophilum]MDJ1178363.1 FHA domain-containing protein [Roseofilum halophilum BLCC-M91]